MRVQLVVTGDLERLGLGPSLERTFRALGHEVAFETAQKVHGMTTNPLPVPSQATIPTSVQRMAEALVAGTLIKKTTRAPLPDLVVGVDDLELANLDQPERVVGWVRRGIRASLEAMYPSSAARERAALELRQRCSFHLVAPLVEAYFFGHEAALTMAGVPPQTSMHLVGEDLERFETSDPDFLARAAAINDAQAAAGRPWWREERHPKLYLQHLKGEAIYRETVHGLDALRAIEWPAIKRRPETVPLLRALFEDVADLLGATSPLADGPASSLTYPGKAVRAEERTLRNL